MAACCREVQVTRRGTGTRAIRIQTSCKERCTTRHAARTRNTLAPGQQTLRLRSPQLTAGPGRAGGGAATSGARRADPSARPPRPHCGLEVGRISRGATGQCGLRRRPYGPPPGSRWTKRQCGRWWPFGRNTAATPCARSCPAAGRSAPPASVAPFRAASAPGCAAHTSAAGTSPAAASPSASQGETAAKI